MESPEANPYAPPVTAVVPNISGYDLGEFYPAGNGKRFLNFIIDRVAMVGVIVLLGVGGAVLEEAGVVHFMAWLEQMNRLEEFLLEIVVSVGYYLALESMFGLSLGKLVTGTRVVNEHGRKPSLLAVLGRTLARLVPFEAFSFFGSRPGGWHDHWSGTMVIDVRNRQPKLAPGLRKIYNR
jgi:uncharacterized RDD family membrane protein YckC